MNWQAFRESAPELASFFERRLRETGICLMATIRSDGWPRISPIEAYVVESDLMLGMMWQSFKARDLLRDSRISIATPQCDKEPKDGDLKLYGRAADVADTRLRKAHADVQEAAIQWRPTEPYHLFSLNVDRGGFISFGEGRALLRWTAKTGLERLKHPDD